ncbi:hypothetical protein ACTFIW_007981 [Dictyostelium discoideum]
MYSYNCESLDCFLLNSETNVLDYLNTLVNTLDTNPISYQAIDNFQDQLDLPNFENDESLAISITPASFPYDPCFDTNGYSDLTSLLNSIHSFSRQDKIIELQKVHSWEKIILLYKSLTIDGNFLKNNPETRINIARYIICYKNTLQKLINYYLDREDIDLEKWNGAIEKNKILLHQRLKSMFDILKSNPSQTPEKEFCDALQLPAIYQ